MLESNSFGSVLTIVGLILPVTIVLLTILLILSYRRAKSEREKLYIKIAAIVVGIIGILYLLTGWQASLLLLISWFGK